METHPDMPWVPEPGNAFNHPQKSDLTISSPEPGNIIKQPHKSDRTTPSTNLLVFSLKIKILPHASFFENSPQDFDSSESNH